MNDLVGQHQRLEQKHFIPAHHLQGQLKHLISSQCSHADDSSSSRLQQVLFTAGDGQLDKSDTPCLTLCGTAQPQYNAAAVAQ